MRRVVTAVLDGEGAGPAAVSVTFVRGPGMRLLNQRAFGRNATTDVIAFPLPHDNCVTGDIYVCPDVARVSARELGVPEREELVRLVVHGTLHILGYNHPESAQRIRSGMWKRQERYVRQLARKRA